MPTSSAAAIAAAWIGSPASAQALSVRTAGSLTSVAAHDGEDFTRRRDKVGAVVQVSVDATLGDVSARIALDQSSTRDIGTRTSAVSLKDAWVRYSHGSIDLTAGRQFLPEGRSDRIRPLDQFAPRDLTRIATVDARQRLTLPAVRVDYALDERLTASVAYIRQDQGYVLPYAATRLLPPGRTLRNSPVDAGFVEVAFRGDGAEIGVNLGHGASPLPALTIVGAQPRQIVVAQTRVAISGSYTIGGGVLRFDLAAIVTDDAAAPGIERRGAFGALGYDIGVWANANASVQLVARKSSRRSVEIGLEALAHANAALQQTSRDRQVWATVSLRQSFQSAHDIEGGGLISAAGEYAGYLAWNWRPADRWRFSVQAQGGHGPRDSLIATVLPNFRVFNELQFSF